MGNTTAVCNIGMYFTRLDLVLRNSDLTSCNNQAVSSQSGITYHEYGAKSIETFY